MKKGVRVSREIKLRIRLIRQCEMSVNTLVDSEGRAGECRVGLVSVTGDAGVTWCLVSVTSVT